MNNVVDTVKGMFNKSEEPFTAERAWVETTYGNGSYRPLERRIKDKQEYIKSIIKGRCSNGGLEGTTLSRAYRCVIDFEEDLKHHIDEVFQPFVEGGFNIINLSEHIKELSGENVYLISWKHAFETKRTNDNISPAPMKCKQILND